MGIAALAIVVAFLTGSAAHPEEGWLEIGPPFRVVRSHDLGDGLLAHEIRDGDGPVCAAGSDGAPPAGLVLTGHWDERMDWHPGGGTLACLGGAAAKCVLAGYRPWEGATARDRHLACVRMVRADYCGDGVTHTRPGVPIRIVAAPEPAPEGSESGWRPDGATRIRRTRFPEGLAYVRRHCPERLRADGPAPLLWNE